MFCSNCGAQISDQSKFCPSCGQPIQQQSQQPQPAQASYGQQPYQQQAYQQPYQQSYAQPSYSPASHAPGAPVAPLPMNWHKFLVYFGLWAGAVYNLISGILALTGKHYGSDSKLVYFVIPSLKTPDVIFGIAVLAMAVMGVITAINLLSYKALGPKLVCILYLVGGCITLIYVIWVAIILSDYDASLGNMIATTIVSLVVDVLMFIANKVYYGKRASMFVR